MNRNNNFNNNANLDGQYAGDNNQYNTNQYFSENNQSDGGQYAGGNTQYNANQYFDEDNQPDGGQYAGGNTQYNANQYVGDNTQYNANQCDYTDEYNVYNITDDITSQNIQEYYSNSNKSNNTNGGGAKAKTAANISFKTKTFIAIIIACIAFSSVLGAVTGSMLNSNSYNSPLIYNNDRSNYTNVSTVAADGKTISEVVKQTENTVVEITTETVTKDKRISQLISQGAGSGVIISSDGYIVTNNHVISGSSKITITLKDGTEYEASIIGTDASSDLAVLKINANNLKAAVLGDSSMLAVGDLAIAVGNPLGELGGTVTNGIISALDREITIDGQTMTLLQTDAAINSGNSGGGLFDGNGNLIGIVNAKSSGDGVEGLGFAIPVNTVREVVDNIIKYGYVKGRVELGISLLDIQDAQTAIQYGVSSTGIYIVEIKSGSSAELAGLSVGDKILSVNGTSITQSAQITNIISTKSVGDKLSIEVVRQGKTITIQVELTEVTQ